MIKLKEKSIFYQRILELSKQQGKSLNSIERELSFPRNALSNYKNGNYPRGDRLIKLSHYFNVEPEFLLGENYNAINDDTEEMFKNLKFQQKLYMSKKSIEWLFQTIDLPSSLKTVNNYDKKEIAYDRKENN